MLSVKNGSTGSVEIGDTQKFDTSIDGNLAENGDSAPIFSKVIRRELSHNSSADIYLRCRAEFMIIAVGTKAPEIMHLGIPAANASDELRSFVTPATRFGRTEDGSNWSARVHIFGEVTAAEMSRTRSEQNYSHKTDFESRKENQDFGHQNISMSQPPLKSTTFGMNTTRRTISSIESIPIRTKTPEPAPLTRPTYSSTRPMESPTRTTDPSKGRVKAHVPVEPESYSSLSDSSSNKYDLLNDTKYSKSNKKKYDTKKKDQKHKKQDSSDSLSSDSDSSDDSDYRRKRRKKKSHQKKDPIKLCVNLTAKLLTTAYKSKIIKFKLDEDPHQRRIYFLTFVESLEMIFPSINKLVTYS